MALYKIIEWDERYCAMAPATREIVHKDDLTELRAWALEQTTERLREARSHVGEPGFAVTPAMAQVIDTVLREREAK